MKKYLFLLFGVLMLSARLPAQTGVTGNLTDHSTDCSTTNSCIAVPVLQNEGGVVFTLAGTFSGTVQFEASADGGTTWAALNATPSNSTTLATNATAPGTWQANIAAFTNVRLRCSVFSSGTINARINLSTASARAERDGWREWV